MENEMETGVIVNTIAIISTITIINITFMAIVTTTTFFIP